jgi:hypothetical protein
MRANLRHYADFSVIVNEIYVIRRVLLASIPLFKPKLKLRLTPLPRATEDV